MKPPIKLVYLVRELINKHRDGTVDVCMEVSQKLLGILRAIPLIPTALTEQQLIVAGFQYYMYVEGINAGPVDGLWGPQSQYAYDEYIESLDVENGWPYQSEKAMNAFFGEVGTNQVRLQLPYEMKLAWDLEKTITTISCNAKVADSLGGILESVRDQYGKSAISELRLDLFGGCLHVRKMRGGSKWSTHAWGAAMDIDPANNRLRWGKEKASLAKPEYEKFWRTWEREGWVSLGRTENRDWMHVQAARR